MVLGFVASTGVAIAQLSVETRTILLTALLVGPLIAAIGATTRQTILVTVYAIALTVPCAIDAGIWGTHDQLVRTSTVTFASIGAVGFARLRELRDLELSETRPHVLDAQKLRLALDAGDMGTWVWDLTVGKVEWDDNLERLFGLAPGEFDGSFDTYVSLVHPEDRDGALTAVRHGMERGEPWRFDHRVIWRDGTVHWLEGRGEPVRDRTGSIIGASGVTANIDARRALLAAERRARQEAETSSSALRRLSEVTTSLSASATVDEVGDVIVSAGVEALTATSGYFATVDETAGELVMRAQFGYPDWIVRRYGHVSLDATVPASEVTRTGESIFIESAEDRRERYPHFEDDPTHEAFVVVPIMSSGRSVAVVAFGFGSPREFSDDDRRYVAAVVQACGQALRRATAYEAEQAIRVRLRTLLDASEELANLDDPDRVMQAVTRIAATRIGEWASLALVDGDGAPRRASEAFGGGGNLAPRMQEVFEREVDHGAAVRSVAATGGPAEYRAGDADGADNVSWIVVPMAVADRTLAVLAIASTTNGRSVATDVELALDLARRGASALERVRLRQAARERAEEERAAIEARAAAEHRLVELLQRTIVPDRLPELPGIELAAQYRPAEVAVDVGGDWYDAFVGRDGRLALVVGDVAGHGIEAASLMGRVRNALRAYAIEDMDASSILRRLHHMLSTLDDVVMVTAFVACLDPTTNELAWSRAGHPPPLLVDADGQSTFLDDVNGAPLGTMAKEYATHVTTLQPGSLLVGYTDGLVERRDCVLDEGLAWLQRRATQQHHNSLDDLCRTLVDDPFVPHPFPDDVCVLALRVGAAPAADSGGA
jgi:PAS domain S-box-containing protein